MINIKSEIILDIKEDDVDDIKDAIREAMDIVLEQKKISIDKIKERKIGYEELKPRSFSVLETDDMLTIRPTGKVGYFLAVIKGNKLIIEKKKLGSSQKACEIDFSDF